jgi:hypothetical protein
VSRAACVSEITFWANECRRNGDETSEWPVRSAIRFSILSLVAPHQDVNAHSLFAANTNTRYTISGEVWEGTQ